MTKIGKHLIHFDRLPSTNAYAAELLSKSNPAEGTVITTDNQYAGRGQMQNTWESEAKKNVSLTVILYPKFLKVSQQFFLNQAVSLAVYKTITQYAPDFKANIKWPNDIYIAQRKVAGILIQNQIQGEIISSTIVGIGINLNQRVFHSDAPNPISLIHLIDRITNRQQFTADLIEQLSQEYDLLLEKQFSFLNDRYHKALYQINQPCFYEIDGHQSTGTIIGVDDYGRLQVEFAGQLRSFGFKEIKYC